VNNEPSNVAATPAKVDKDVEYVWDVFFHRPAITGIVSVANIATMCVMLLLHILVWRCISYLRSGVPSVAGQYDSESDEDSAGDEDDEDSNSTHDDLPSSMCYCLTFALSLSGRLLPQ
jgi:hypothetical protein